MYLCQLSSQEPLFAHPHAYTRIPTVCMCTLIYTKADLSLLSFYPSLFIQTLIQDPLYPPMGLFIRQ